jgi:hypothetical protein
MSEYYKGNRGSNWNYGGNNWKLSRSKIDFDVSLIAHKGNDSWVEEALRETKECLDCEIPESNFGCDMCNYRKAVNEVENK